MNLVKKNHLNLSPDLGKIIKPFPRQVQELAVLLISFGLQELKHERTARANIVTTWQEIATYECLEHARFATALATNHRHLRQLDRRLTPQLCEYVLQLVDQRYHGASQRHRRRLRLSSRRVCSWFVSHRSES